MRVITEEGGRSARVEGEQYAWEWSMQDDRFSVRDARGRTIVRGTLQPAVAVSPRDGTGTNRCAGGMPVEHEARDNAVTVRYEGVNGSAQLLITWRFGEEGLWLEPIVYNTGAEEDIVSLTYFARTTGESVSPALHSSHCVVPGLSMSSGVSPVVQAEAELNLTTSL